MVSLVWIVKTHLVLIKALQWLSSVAFQLIIFILFPQKISPCLFPDSCGSLELKYGDVRICSTDTATQTPLSIFTLEPEMENGIY